MRSSGAQREVLLLVVVFAMPVMAGCLDEQVQPGASGGPVDWPVGATWAYHYTHQIEKARMVGQETRMNHAVGQDEVHFTVIDHGRVEGREAVALSIEGQGDVYAETAHVLGSGVYLLDAQTQEPLAGPRGVAGWDPFCSITTDGAVVPFWPQRLPLQPDTKRKDVLSADVAHVNVHGVETVDTAAGRFEAVRIEVTLVPLPPTDQYRRVTYWYAEAAGNIVLMERDYMTRTADVTVYDRAVMELVSFSLDPDDDAHWDVPVLVVDPRQQDHIIEPASHPGALHTHIVSDQPKLVPLDGNATLRFAMGQDYVENGPPVASRSAPHQDIYSLAQVDWGDTQIRWSTREADRPWRDAGLGAATAVTTSNVTRLSVRAELVLGEDMPCLNGSSQREQTEHLTAFTTFAWKGEAAVPAGTPEPAAVVELPSAVGGVQVRLNWTVRPAEGWPFAESGRPVADCDDCAAVAASRGEAFWWLSTDETPLTVEWAPVGLNVSGLQAPVTGGQSVRLQVQMASYMACCVELSRQ